MEGLLVLVALAVLAVPVLLIVTLVSLGGVKTRVAELERQLDAMRRAASARETVTAPPRETPVAAPTPPVTPPPVPEAAPPRETPRPTPRPTPADLPEPWRVQASEPEAEPEAPRAPPPRARVAPARPDIVTMGLRMVQRWFMTGNVPVKIGILVLFAGVASLLKYASDQGWMRMPIELRLAGIAGGQSTPGASLNVTR